MEAILIPNGILHMSESKANCPHCERDTPFEEFEIKFNKSKDGHIRHKCKGCKRFMGITSDIIGDFVAYILTNQSGK